MKRPAEVTTASFGTVAALLLVALKVTSEWSAFWLALIAWLPAAVTGFVEWRRQRP